MRKKEILVQKAIGCPHVSSGCSQANNEGFFWQAEDSMLDDVY